MPRLKIDGNEYEFPTLDSINLDEAVILERYAGVTLDKLEPGDGLPAGALKGLIIIAVARVRTDATEREIAERIGQLKLTELNNVVQDDEPDEPDPPSPASADNDASTARSGGAGLDGGAPPPAPSHRNGTGTPVSDTGPVSVPETSAV